MPATTLTIESELLSFWRDVSWNQTWDVLSTEIGLSRNTLGNAIRTGRATEHVIKLLEKARKNRMLALYTITQ